MKKIRILHVVPKISEGGVASVILNYYGKLNKDQYSFDYVTHEDNNGQFDHLLKNNTRIFCFKTIGQIGLIKYFFQIKNNLSITDYQIIHIHTGHLTGLYALLFRLNGCGKIIAHAHTTESPNKYHSVIMPLWRLLSVLLSNKLIACGKLAGNFCFGRSNFEILRNGIDIKNFSTPKVESAYLKKELNLKDNDLVVGNIAAFIPQKNHKFIIKIFHDFIQTGRQGKLLLVGDGPLKKEIEELVKSFNINDNVIFLGQRKDIYSLLSIFDVFILPSLFEGLPVSGIEAQAAGIPCYFSDQIDFEVDIKIGLSAFLPIDKGTKPWIEAITKKNKLLSNQLIEEALIRSGYDINSSSHKLEKIYIDLT